MQQNHLYVSLLSIRHLRLNARHEPSTREGTSVPYVGYVGGARDVQRNRVYKMHADRDWEGWVELELGWNEKLFSIW